MPEHTSYWAYWGKTAHSEEGALVRHPLAYHCLDVAAVGDRLLGLHPALSAAIAALLDLPVALTRAVMRVLLALHDLGKLSLPFQACRPECFRGLLPPASVVLPHTVAGRLLWDDRSAQVQRVLAARLCGTVALPPALARWGEIVIAHHGRPFDPDEAQGLLFRRVFRPEDVAAACSLVDDAAGAVIAEGRGLASDAGQLAERRVDGASWLIAGVTILCDWIGSNRRWFPFFDEPVPLAEYWSVRALPHAERALAAAGVLPVRSAPHTPFATLFSKPEPTPLQALVDHLDLGAGPTMIVIEDLTGSGKTEAALTLVHRLMAAGRADGFYVALPTAATADAMFDRVGEVYRRLFRQGGRPSLVLAHGSRDISETFLETIAAEDSPSDLEYARGDADTASRTCAAWLADSSKKALLAPAGVGTVDQALLGVLRVRHQALRLLGLARKVLVVDEVHACDAYMLGLLKVVLEHHAMAGGSAILLSATLPAGTRDSLCAAFLKGLGQPPHAGSEAPYPAVTQATVTTGVRSFPVAPWRRQRRRLGVCLVHAREEAMTWLMEQVTAGTCAAWVCNTVADALETFDALRGVVPDERLSLFHARMALGDRLAVERDVVARFGPQSGARERRSQVLIATQVVEQSLDLDFDDMVVDLCPIDLVLQRAGRLRRHPRRHDGQPLDVPNPKDRRGPAVLRVISPVPADDAAAGWYAAMFRRGAMVYRDHARLWLTASELASRGSIRLPEDSRSVIEAVYGSEAENRVPPGLLPSLLDAEGRAAAERSYARDRAIALPLGYGGGAELKGWSDDEERRTRLGERTVTLRLARWDGNELRPWFEHPRHAWRLSEVSVRRAALAGCAPVGDPALERAMVAVSESWRDRGRWTVLLPLREGAGGTWVGRGSRDDGREVDVQYDPRRGLEMG